MWSRGGVPGSAVAVRDVTHDEFTRLGEAVEQLRHAGEDLVLLVERADRHVRPGPDQTQQLVPVKSLGMPELRHLEYPEMGTRSPDGGGTSARFASALPITRDSSATHGAVVSLRFHANASRPPGRRTRAISGTAKAWSNQ